MSDCGAVTYQSQICVKVVCVLGADDLVQVVGS